MPPVFWLIDCYIPNLELKYGTLDFHGKLLIISEQLWSILKGSEVRSMLIGPGFLYGKGEIKGYPVEVKEPLISIILDATELRPNQEIPLIDLMNPDVIDPTSKADMQSIVVNINKIFRKYGQTFFQRKLVEIKEKGKIPVTVGVEDVSQSINVKTFSGRDKLRFVLGGENNKLYSNLKKLIESNKFSSYKYMNILRSDTKKIVHVDSSDELDGWIIVEKSAEISPDEPVSFIQSVLNEFNRVMNEIRKNIDYYIIV
ncbi:MAG: hypothetical protein ACTSQY_06535 [Candidatus Odinarchaeia archaeon]